MNPVIVTALLLASAGEGERGAVEDEPARRAPEASRISPISPALDFGVSAAAGAGWGGLHLLVPKLVRTSCPCRRSDVNPIDRPSVDWHLDANEKPAYAALGLSLASSVAALLLSDPSHENALAEFSVVLETTMVTGMVGEGVKIAASRPYPFMARPTTHPLQNGDEINYQSFWSSHTAVPMAAAAATIYILHKRGASKGWKVLAWTGGALLALVAGSLEVAAGNHYPTDVFAGGLAGVSAGLVNPWLHGI